MKNTRLLSLLTLMLCLCALSGKSQHIDTLSVNSSTKALALANKLNRELTLTPDQKVKVLEILKHRSGQWQEQVVNAAQADKKVKIENINKNAFKEVSLILTKEQIEIYHQLRKDLKQQKDQNKAKSRISDEDMEMDF